MPATEHRLAAARSLLFVPGDDPRKLTRGWDSRADGVIADLEDAVLPQRKRVARETVRASLSAADGNTLRLVRVNSPETPWGAADLDALADSPVDAIVVPKATPQSLAMLPQSGPPVIALIETALGLRQAYEIASHPRVLALALGGADLGAELKWQTRRDGLELLHARSVLVLDSAAADLRAPFDVVQLDPSDGDSLRRQAETARSLGFGGKTCIHPAQVDVVNAIFSPSADQIDQAREVVDAYESAVATGSSAVTVVRGRLVDAPVAARARSTLESADVLGLLTPRAAT